MCISYCCCCYYCFNTYSLSSSWSWQPPLAHLQLSILSNAQLAMFLVVNDSLLVLLCEMGECLLFSLLLLGVLPRWRIPPPPNFSLAQYGVLFAFLGGTARGSVGSERASQRAYPPFQTPTPSPSTWKDYSALSHRLDAQWRFWLVLKAVRLILIWVYHRMCSSVPYSRSARCDQKIVGCFSFYYNCTECQNCNNREQNLVLCLCFWWNKPISQGLQWARGLWAHFVCARMIRTVLSLL